MKTSVFYLGVYVGFCVGFFAAMIGLWVYTRMTREKWIAKETKSLTDEYFRGKREGIAQTATEFGYMALGASITKDEEQLIFARIATLMEEDDDDDEQRPH